MPDRYSLLYFDIHGRGEAIRLLFKHAGVEFEDRRITFEQFGGLKPNDVEVPLGSLPVLTTTCGKKIVQTTSILRYVAEELKLNGANNVERALIDSIVVTTKELHDSTIDLIFYTIDNDKPSEEKKLKEKIHKSFKFFESVAKKHGKSNNFVGKSTSLADIYFIDLINLLNQALPGTTILNEFLLLKNIDSKTRNLPNLKKYLAERR